MKVTANRDCRFYASVFDLVAVPPPKGLRRKYAPNYAPGNQRDEWVVMKEGEQRDNVAIIYGLDAAHYPDQEPVEFASDIFLANNDDDGLLTVEH